MKKKEKKEERIVCLALLLMRRFKILDMFNIVCRPIRGLFGRPEKCKFQLVGHQYVGHHSTMITFHR